MDEQDWKILGQWLAGYIGLCLVVGIVAMAFFHVSFIKVIVGSVGILVTVGIILFVRWMLNNRQ